jgi:hypothetical protein
VLVLVPGPVLLVVGPVFVPVLLPVVGPLWVAVVLLVVPPVPGLALPEEHACESAMAQTGVMIDTCNARMRFIISPRFSQVRRWPLPSSLAACPKVHATTQVPSTRIVVKYTGLPANGAAWIGLRVERSAARHEMTPAFMRCFFSANFAGDLHTAPSDFGYRRSSSGKMFGITIAVSPGRFSPHSVGSEWRS